VPAGIAVAAWLLMRKKDLASQATDETVCPTDRIRDARRQLDILGQLPPIENRPCGFGNCSGQTSRTPCKECVREREEHAARAAADPSAPPEPAQNAANTAPAPYSTFDLNATADPSPEHCPDRCTLNAERCSESCNLSLVTCTLHLVTCNL
jgi:hypothetical protein